ncbi:MAG: hypothetical protein QOG53_155 [Frankiales bacterium]|nr:hypothetical protein [Frankiales bacterium]
MHAVLLGIHIAAGSLGLLLGPIAMTAPKRPGRHTRAGLAYQGATAVLAVTAIGLAVFNWSELWFLALIAVGTEAAALGGWWVQERRRPGWLPVHISLMCGSYISFVTALLVVNSNSIIAWILPTIVGSPLIAWAASVAATGRGSSHEVGLRRHGGAASRSR